MAAPQRGSLQRRTRFSTGPGSGRSEICLTTLSNSVHRETGALGDGGNLAQDSGVDGLALFFQQGRDHQQFRFQMAAMRLGSDPDLVGAAFQGGEGRT